MRELGGERLHVRDLGDEDVALADGEALPVRPVVRRPVHALVVDAELLPRFHVVEHDHLLRAHDGQLALLVRGQPGQLDVRPPAARATASASRTLNANGFSTRHGLPASMHCRASRAWVAAGDATTTASTRPSRSAVSPVTCAPGYWRASRSRTLGSVSHTAVSSPSASAAAVRTWFLPHIPAPITPSLRRLTGRIP